jgi:hypothetical protein
MLPSALIYDVGTRVVCFRSSIAHPAYTPVYASLCTSRYPVQDSGPSRSLVLSRKNFSFSASSRFNPAHKPVHYTQNPSMSVIEILRQVSDRSERVSGADMCPALFENGLLPEALILTLREL